ELGGFDERFASPGGGYVNLDAYRRALDLPRTRLIVLLGEGTFHQVHGGAATSGDAAQRDAFGADAGDAGVRAVGPHGAALAAVAGAVPAAAAAVRPGLVSRAQPGRRRRRHGCRRAFPQIRPVRGSPLAALSRSPMRSPAFSPCPVSTTTVVSPGRIVPSARSRRAAAAAVAAVGST